MVEIVAARGVAGAEAHKVETVDRLIGARMAQPHRAEPDDENALALHAFGAAAFGHWRLLSWICVTSRNDVRRHALVKPPRTVMASSGET